MSVKDFEKENNSDYRLNEGATKENELQEIKSDDEELNAMIQRKSSVDSGEHTTNDSPVAQSSEIRT